MGTSYLIKEETLQNIADSIRQKTDEPAQIAVSDFADKILKIEAGADVSGTASNLVSAHNTATDSHSDIREAVNNKLNSNELPTAINTALAQAKVSGEFDGADGKTPIKGTDYWTEDDQETIIQRVLTELGAIPVFGMVDENNNIILTAVLANGTYYLKYADADGNVTNICTYVHNYVPAPAYKNLFDAATCTLNKRGNSTGTTSNCDGVFITDYIDIGDVMAGGGINQLHYKGMYFDVNNLTNTQGTPYTYLNYYDANKAHLGHVSMRTVGDAQTAAGDYAVTLDAAKTTARYIRVTAAVLPKATGTLTALTSLDQLADCKLALNETITD